MIQQRLINTFFDIVKINSPTGEEEKVANYLIDRLQGHGLRALKDSYGNVIARTNGVREPIFFTAHMDTVEPGRGIHPRVDGDNLISDGTTILGGDNKVAIAAMLEMVECLPKIHRQIEFLFTRSEEVGNYGAINLDFSQIQSKMGYCFDVSQPVGTIVTASPFYERFDIRLLGRSAHASHPEEAHPVFQALSEILAAAHFGKVDNDTLFNIGVIQGGQVRNTILGEITLRGEIRSFVSEKLQQSKEEFRKLVQSIAKKYNLSVEEEWVWENPGYKLMGEKTEAAIQEVESIMGGLHIIPNRIEIGGVSDANIFNDKDLLCLNLGDGTENPHTTRERIKISELEKLTELMLALVTNCKIG